MMEGLKLAQICAQLCLDKKAENVVILDLENKSSVADFFVVCSGFSDRQVKAIADFVSDEMKRQGVKALSEEGMVDGRWALIDFGPVIVHVFQDNLRDFYNLEGLWQDAPRTYVREDETMSRNPSYGSDFSSGTANY